MEIDRLTYNEIIKYYDKPIPEKGGVLGGNNLIVTEFFPDCSTTIANANQYMPNIYLINQTIESWSEKNIEFMGFIHSHPVTQEKLSFDDIRYISKIMKCCSCKVNQLYFPVALGAGKIMSYKASIQSGEIRIIEDRVNVIEIRRKNNEKS